MNSPEDSSLASSLRDAAQAPVPVARARRRTVLLPLAPSRMLMLRAVSLPAGKATLTAELALPAQATGLVLFAHGNGSSRLSSRSRQIRALLHQADLGTLCLNLLTPNEDHRLRAAPCDVPLLVRRVVAAGQWVQQQPELLGMRLGLLGDDTAVAAALGGAAEPGSRVGAVVALGGHPDCAAVCLAQVQAPTLLLVGDTDAPGLHLYQQAQQAIGSNCELHQLPHAGCVFQEGAPLVQAIREAAAWFNRHLAKPAPRWER